MTIGEKIRHYRLEKGMTQETLASELNMSFQAVSKWERNESLPDITIVSRLCGILDISCDTLLAHHDHFTETEIRKTLDAADAFDDTIQAEYAAKVSMLEKALEKYPLSMELMSALADTYSKESDFPEYAGSGYLERAAELHRYIAANADDGKLKYHSVQILCYLYRAWGKYDLAKELAESMPELCQSRPALLYHSMPEDKVREGIHDYVIQLLDTAESMMGVLLHPRFGESEQSCFESLRRSAGMYLSENRGGA